MRSAALGKFPRRRENRRKSENRRIDPPRLLPGQFAPQLFAYALAKATGEPLLFKGDELAIAVRERCLIRLSLRYGRWAAASTGV